MNSIFNMFGPSPIKPIEQHMHKVHTCAKQLCPFFDSVIKADWPQALAIHKTILRLENEADQMKKELRLHLPSGLFLPVPRTDLLELLHYQDKIANKTRDITGTIIARKISLPEKIKHLLPPFVRICVNASRQACKAINELDALLESGFRGNEVKIVEDMIIKLDEIEHESDKSLAIIRSEIFNIESEISPVDIIFLYKIVEWIGELADHAETVGGRLQILLAR